VQGGVPARGHLSKSLCILVANLLYFLLALFACSLCLSLSLSVLVCLGLQLSGREHRLLPPVRHKDRPKAVQKAVPANVLRCLDHRLSSRLRFGQKSSHLPRQLLALNLGHRLCNRLSSLLLTLLPNGSDSLKESESALGWLGCCCC